MLTAADMKSSLANMTHGIELGCSSGWKSCFFISVPVVQLPAGRALGICSQFNFKRSCTIL